MGVCHEGGAKCICTADGIAAGNRCDAPVAANASTEKPIAENPVDTTARVRAANGRAMNCQPKAPLGHNREGHYRSLRVPAQIRMISHAGTSAYAQRIAPRKYRYFNQLFDMRRFVQGHHSSSSPQHLISGDQALQTEGE